MLHGFPEHPGQELRDRGALPCRRASVGSAGAKQPWRSEVRGPGQTHFVAAGRPLRRFSGVTRGANAVDPRTYGRSSLGDAEHWASGGEWQRGAGWDQIGMVAPHSEDVAIGVGDDQDRPVGGEVGSAFDQVYARL